MHPDDHIRRGGAEDLDGLEPLWVSVHHRHVESMPELAPYVDDAYDVGARATPRPRRGTPGSR